MAQEYRLEEVLLALEDEQVLDSLLRQRGTLESFEYYNSNPSEIINEIVKTDKHIQYIKGLISIYPLSTGILKELMVRYDVQSMRDKIFAWLDVSDTLSNMVNKFFSLCSDGIKETGEESELEAEIAELERKKETLQVEREKHEENKKKLASKRQEVDEIKAQCEEMANRYSPEVLKKEEEKYKREKDKLLKKKREFDEKLRKLEEEMSPYRNNGNKTFDKAMDAFSKVISTLPKDEG